MTDLIELTRKDFSELTQAEKEDLLSEAFRLSEAGDEEGSDEIYRLFPVSARLAKGLKNTVGAKIMKEIGYNYSEAEALYGKDWLDR